MQQILAPLQGFFNGGYCVNSVFSLI